MTRQPEGSGLDRFDVSIDRDAEVPMGVQLGWALSASIQDGNFEPGQRLPPLRELAETTGLNINTVRVVYQRLEQKGLIQSQQGSGTFVAATPRRPSGVAAIAAKAAHDAHETGVDLREVAAALYVSPESPQPSDGAASRRHALRTQISVLERAIGELEAAYPGLVPASAASGAGPGPTLLGIHELEHVRSQLIRRLATVQGAIDQLTQVDDKPTSTAHKRQADKREATTVPKRTPRPRATGRPATAGA
jgi:DNA-binding transcriptional regulator YhcF (GntR family)